MQTAGTTLLSSYGVDKLQCSEGVLQQFTKKLMSERFSPAVKRKLKVTVMLQIAKK